MSELRDAAIEITTKPPNIETPIPKPAIPPTQEAQPVTTNQAHEMLEELAHPDKKGDSGKAESLPNQPSISEVPAIEPLQFFETINGKIAEIQNYFAHPETMPKNIGEEIAGTFDQLKSLEAAMAANPSLTTEERTKLESISQTCQQQMATLETQLDELRAPPQKPPEPIDTLPRPPEIEYNQDPALLEYMNRMEEELRQMREQMKPKEPTDEDKERMKRLQAEQIAHMRGEKRKEFAIIMGMTMMQQMMQAAAQGSQDSGGRH